MKYAILFLVCLMPIHLAYGAYTIEFVEAPPAVIPAAVDRIYSVPLNQRISRPIIAQLHENGMPVTEGDIAGTQFTVTSMDVDVANGVGGAVDSWANTGGILCQWANNIDYPRRMDRRFCVFLCGTNNALPELTAFSGKMIAEAMYHKHTDLPNKNRVFRFSMVTPDGDVVTADTNAVEVTSQAQTLQYTVQPPASISANNPFSVTVQIVDKNGALVSTGLDSTAFVNLAVAYQFKTFYHQVGKEMFLKSAEVRLESSEAITHASYYDRIIRKRAVGGIVQFNDIRMLDVYTGVQLNATVSMARDPWIRTPDIYDDLSAKIVSESPSGEVVFNYDASVSTDPPVVLSNPFDVTAQTGTQLQILTPASDITTKIGANFPIVNDIVVEIQDASGNRIYSGSDSTSNIVTIPTPVVCLSVDAHFALVDGRGVFVGSICEINAAVSLEFECTSTISSLTFKSAPTHNIEVTGDIYMAHYIGVYHSGSSSDVQPHMESFVKFAVKDINEGVVYPGLLAGRTLKLKTFDTKKDVTHTVNTYMEMMEEGQKKPNEIVRAMIGFGHNTLTEKLSPLLNRDKMPLLATRDDKIEFGDKALYPYYNRLSWHEGVTYHAALLASKQRRWTHIAVIRSYGYTLTQTFYEKAKVNNIIIMEEIVIPELAQEDWIDGSLSEYMARMKNCGTRIFFNFVPAPLTYWVLREAISYGIASIHGYQWVTLGIFTWAFPWANQHPVCVREPICTVAFTGLHGFSPTYAVSAFKTPDWLRVMGYHMYSDRSIYKGRVKYVIFEVGAEFSLPYDGVRAYATAMNNLIAAQETLTGPKIALAVRQVEFAGLTGRVHFDEDGNRPGYLGFLVTVNPIPPQFGIMPTQTAIFVRYCVMEGEQATDQLEIPIQAYYPLYLPPYNFVLGQAAYPNTTFTNVRYFNSTSGMFGRETQSIIEIPGATEPVHDTLLQEVSVAPFYCENGCGGEALDETDIGRYELGTCTAQDVCTCVPGYFGDYCDSMICSCKNGHCDVPQVCICDEGWVGNSCETAICPQTCEPATGSCTGPGICTCISGLYIGDRCQINVLVVAIPTIIAIILIVVGLFFLIRWVTKNQARAAALKNLDWLVKWEDVEGTDLRAVSLVSTASENLGASTKENVALWKGQKCFVQKFHCESLNVSDETIRLEMVMMKELRHANINTFIGACLEAPEVSLLSEVTPKGSLEDLLSNESVKLGWDFKFSILKDIARGMEFLQKSEIGSHGRLKSTNCLVDNRWTCKIAGFGIPTMRFWSQKLPDYEDEFKLSSMFWTAPELLKECDTLDDVVYGTKAGDVYSFAIIVTEICTREQPFTHELGFMSDEDVLQLIRDKHCSAAAEARQLWQASGANIQKPFRPVIDNSSYPEAYESQREMKKMLEHAWNEDPDARPTFKGLLSNLNVIWPVKGELIDNLVNMLEKYSSNLEAIVLDRTKELIVEKAKTEQLVSQMLPKKVVEDLKHGRKVEPESFDCVTIYFSDIVGFTNIAKESTPFQVVDLLNDLYTTFDAILDNYDTYKVETIGDAYMVVSGLPIRNGILHAGEIATMSLDLLSAICDFKMRHMPEKTMQLRIGMHSGKCVAGVVGLKMPRYCLFGDTVNTASRMESSSMALKIHMSAATANLLMEIGGYHLECRGEREVKGKGVMTTYWLNGKDGFDKKLPGSDMAASLSQHEFK